MSDKLVANIRNEDYLIQILEETRNSHYVKLATELIKFVQDIYRSLEPGHFSGKLVVFSKRNDAQLFQSGESEKFYDSSILNDSYSSIIFQLLQNNDDLPLIWTNIENTPIETLLSAHDSIAYVYENEQEYFVVNNKRVNIVNKFRCSSIFALQYHYLNEALSRYQNERIITSSCVHFKKCWADEKRIYFKNKPEDCMQESLSEFLHNSIRGVDVVREYNLDASKPVDVRVYWREANRAALIELKWLGKSLDKDGGLSTGYTNARANDGMTQIKEYLDLENSDSPMVITKGYLVVIDGRRKRVNNHKISQISLNHGMAYQNKELDIADDKKYWENYGNIEKPKRMFAEPICEK